MPLTTVFSEIANRESDGYAPSSMWLCPAMPGATGGSLRSSTDRLWSFDTYDDNITHSRLTPLVWSEVLPMILSHQKTVSCMLHLNRLYALAAHLCFTNIRRLSSPNTHHYVSPEMALCP